MSSHDHVTSPPAILEQLRKNLLLDDEFILNHDDGFTWWPSETPVRFRWTRPRREPMAIPATRFSFEIKAVEGINVDEKQRAAILGALTKTFNVFSSAIEDNYLIFRGTAHQLEGGTPSSVARLFNQALFTAHLIDTKSSEITALLSPIRRGIFRRGGARLVKEAHPSRGQRRKASEVPAAFVQHMLEMGAAPIPNERAPDIVAAAHAVQALGIGPVASDVTAEDHTDATSFNVVIESRDVTSLLEINLGQHHPNLGLGMLALLRIRFPEGHLHGSSEQLAAEWNRLEWERSFPIDLAGAWTSHAAGAHVAYSAFYPNSVHNQALARNVAIEMVQRVQWFFEHHGYDTTITSSGPFARRILGEPEPQGLRS